MVEPGPGETPSRYERRAHKDVAKYLLPGEKAIIATRRHWAVLVGPTAKALPALVLGGWLLLRDPHNHGTSVAGLLVLLATVGYLVLRVAEWWMRHFIVSRRRMLLTSGVVVRTVTLLPRRRITDLTWQETFFGQLLGYGTFRIESAGQYQALQRVTFLPHADRLYREISGLLFPDDRGEDDEENGNGPSGGRAARRTVRQDTEPIPGVPPAQ